MIDIPAWLFGALCMAPFTIVALDRYFTRRLIKDAMEVLAERTTVALEVSREARLTLETLASVMPEHVELIELSIRQLRDYDTVLQRGVEMADLVGSGASLWKLQCAHRRSHR